MANPFKLLTIFDWVTPTAEITKEVLKAARNVRGSSESQLSDVDPELLRRIYEEPDKNKPDKVSGKITLTNKETQEWACTFCGTPQPIKNRKCDSCGGNRTFTRR